jgi:uncharacterized protein (DUF1778 family)
MEMSTHHQPKETRLNIRISGHQKEIITQAAQLQHATISDFVIEQAYEAATHLLADNARFVLPKADWDAFCEALDAPTTDIPALRKLLTTPSVFERPAR